LIESIHNRIKSVGSISQERLSETVDRLKQKTEKLGHVIASNRDLNQFKASLEARLSDTRTTLGSYYKELRNRIGS
jgi:hypothetical protein